MAEKKKILIIDDDPDVLDSVKAILDENGFETYTAKDEKESIIMLDKSNPDLVLCDMMMERIDSGARVAHEIKKINPSVPIYLLSSIGDATAGTIDVDTMGFSGVFQKPLEPDLFVSAVKKALGLPAK